MQRFIRLQTIIISDMYQKRHIVYKLNSKTVKQKYRAERMGKSKVISHDGAKNTKGIKCPYLSNNPKKTCVRMVEAGLDGSVSKFDVEHFCMGNPNNCYYFRFSSSQLKSSK